MYKRKNPFTPNFSPEVVTTETMHKHFYVHFLSVFVVHTSNKGQVYLFELSSKLRNN